VVFVVPGPLATRTGGYIYDRRIAEGLRKLGWTVDVCELDGSFPTPAPASLEYAARALGELREGSTVVVDGLAFGAMPDVVTDQAPRLRFVALVHLPLAADVRLDTHTARRVEAEERRALYAAALVIVTGKATLPLLARYELPADQVVVVEPGTDPAPLAHGSGRSAPNLLTVAHLHPGKGHEILLEALSSVAEDDWRLTCAGSLTRHPPTAQRVRALAQRLGLADRVSLVGDLDDCSLAACYDTADVFVLPTLQETYGMAVAEALARGLPVVSTRTGAIPDLVGDDAGLLVPAGDVPALAAALSRVIGEPDLRGRLAAGARRVRGRLPDWQHAATSFAATLESIDTHG
jgi:glycosyltransferase involved in cell wall biosynthesis